MKHLPAQKHQEVWDDGYDSAIDEAITLVRENMGERLINGQWHPGSPECSYLIRELQRMKAT